MGVATRAALVAFVAVTAARVVLAGADQAAPRTTRDKVYSTAQAAIGAKQYAAICASCHDPAKVPAGKKPAKPLVGDKFLENWADRTLGELFTIIQTTMPDDGSYVLSEGETAALVAYLLQANKFPAGSTPLKHAANSKDKDIVIVK